MGGIFKRLLITIPWFAASLALAETVILDPQAIYSAASHLETTNPAAFNGMDVGTFLGADTFYNAGYTGSNTVIANVEAGHVWSSHETLTHVTTQFTGTGALGDVDRHATWVGHMAGGRGAAGYQPGIAYGADLQSGAIATGWTGTPYTLSFNFSVSSFLSAYDHYFTTSPADVINSSWGFSDPAGTSAATWAFDGFCRQSPTTTLVVSAGNSGPSSNTVGSPGSGYNSITVGAMGSANAFDSIASFSSRGPQDYGDPVNGTISGVRAAIDITAPGTSLVGAYYGGTTGGNTGGTAVPGTNLYSLGIGGTSFAAPIVAAGVALLDDVAYGEGLAGTARDARVVKANLLNSAQKPSGWNNGQTDVGGVSTTTQSLDWTFGAGQMDVNQAYSQLLSDVRDVSGVTGGTVDPTGWDYGEIGLAQDNDYLLAVDLAGGSVFTTTLTWFRNRAVDVGTSGFVGKSL
jgi:subtilisin family serine protease